VGQLNAGTGTLGVDKLGDSLKGGDVCIFPDAEIGGGDAAFRGDGRGFQHDEASASLGAAAKVDEVPIGGKAVLRRVLAHGGDADAIGEGDRAQLKGGKEGMAHYGWLGSLGREFVKGLSNG
jgi:hypothetical protein